MGADIPKQYLTLDDRSILDHSIDVLLQISEITSVVVCLAADDKLFEQTKAKSNDRIEHTTGGDTRAQSVVNGLLSISDVAAKDDWVLVHDAARPCLKVNTLQRLIAVAREDSVGAILAVPSNDTLKLAVQCGNNDALSWQIQSTLDRSCIWQAQTPQMFRYGSLLSALQQALQDQRPITDEASAMEYAGFFPRIVMSDPTNIKVTTEQDLLYASYLLKQNKVSQ